METSNLTTLPIIDLKKARDPTQRLAVAKQLVHALETVGFLFLDNVEGYDPDRVLNNARSFFDQSLQERLRVSRKMWNPACQNYYRGYFPLENGDTSYKEGFEIGQNNSPSSEGQNDNIPAFFTECNQWPQGLVGTTDQQFQEDMVQYYWAMLNCGAEVLRLVSLGSGLEENWFKSMFFPDSLSTLRLLHYPPRPEVPDIAKDGDHVLCCSDHSDSGFVTLLSTFTYGGLEIFTEDGYWLPVPCRPKSLVMNIGDMLSAMSGGRFKSTRHRVLDTGIDRFSVPFFFEPCYTADMTRVMPWLQKQAHSQSKSGETSRTNLAQFEGKCYGAHLIEKMRNFVEYKEMLATLKV